MSAQLIGFISNNLNATPVHQDVIVLRKKEEEFENS